jgi:ADP-heptose:LPS heptosyltransferase
LGAFVVALPAMWAVRERFPDARLTLLCNRPTVKSRVMGEDICAGTPLVDDFMYYTGDDTPAFKIRKKLALLSLFLRLRLQRFDTLVYLVHACRAPEPVARHRRFFRLAGIKHIIGTEGFRPLPTLGVDRPLPTVPFEADLLLERLARSGFPETPAGKGRMDLAVTDAERRRVSEWAAGLAPDGGRGWVAVGPGSKMQAKVWPEERFEEVVKRLIERFDVWPVIFGGPEDRELGDRLLRSWGRGYNAAGPLRPRESAAALERCRLYLGNDSGAMHLAAAVDVRCVAVFAARDFPGMWDPYGNGHVVIRRQVDCEGCQLQTCIDQKKKCLMDIGVAEVYESCSRILDASSSP